MTTTNDFEKNGIIFPIPLFQHEQATNLQTYYNIFQTEMQARRGRELFIKPHLAATWIDDIVHHPLVLETVEAAIGPNIVLWSSDFFVKAAGKGTWVSWHQDLPFWNLSTDHVVSVWLAITPSTKEAGAMKVVPGSHRGGHFGRLKGLKEGDDVLQVLASGEKTSAKGDLLSFEQDLQDEIDPDQVVDVELAPGEFSIHHGNLIHGGTPNQATHDRIGFVMRFVSGETYCCSGRDSAMLVQGQMNHAQFELEPRPKADFDTAAMAALEQALSYPSGFGDKPLK